MRSPTTEVWRLHTSPFRPSHDGTGGVTPPTAIEHARWPAVLTFLQGFTPERSFPRQPGTLSCQRTVCRTTRPEHPATTCVILTDLMFNCQAKGRPFPRRLKATVPWPKFTMDRQGPEVKVCPHCGTRWPPQQLLIKCVTCEMVFCPACKDEPTAHRFECHLWRRPREAKESIPSTTVS
jgi:hypothetical protein